MIVQSRGRYWAVSAVVPDKVVSEVVQDVHHVRGDVVHADQVGRHAVLALLSPLLPPGQSQVPHQMSLNLEGKERALSTDFTLDEFY